MQKQGNEFHHFNGEILFLDVIRLRRELDFLSQMWYIIITKEKEL